MAKQNKPFVDQVTLCKQDDGWSVEARVSRLTLGQALALQAYLLAIPEAFDQENKPRVAKREPNLRTMVEEARQGDAPPTPVVLTVVNTEAVVAADPAKLEALTRVVEEPKPAPAKKPLVTAGDTADTELVMRLVDAPKLRDVLLRMSEAGIHGTDALVTTATRIKDRVPVLSRIGDLRERISRAAEVIGVAG